MKRDEMAALGDELMMIARTLPDNVSKETCDKINKASIFLTELGKDNKMKRGEILDSVKKTITQDRNNRHGEPENSFPVIAKRWHEYLEGVYGAGIHGNKLKPSDVAEMMAIFKDCRFHVQPENLDNKHDQIGYLAIAAELRASERNPFINAKIADATINNAKIAEYEWVRINKEDFDYYQTSEIVEFIVEECFSGQTIVPRKNHLLKIFAAPNEPFAYFISQPIVCI